MNPGQSYYSAAWAILAALGITPTDANTNLLVAWQWQEWGTTDGVTATHNPLATSLKTTGVLPVHCTIQTAGGATERSAEPCYDTLDHGARACALTIGNGRYPTLLKALQNSDVTLFFSSTGMSELSVWAGGSTSYGPDIESTYRNLPAPPTPTIPNVFPPGGSIYSKLSLIVGLAGMALTVDQIFNFSKGRGRKAKSLR